MLSRFSLFRLGSKYYVWFDCGLDRLWRTFSWIAAVEIVDAEFVVVAEAVGEGATEVGILDHWHCAVQ